jgi:lauroyl/myristoyl acyltransferase
LEISYHQESFLPFKCDNWSVTFIIVQSYKSMKSKHYLKNFISGSLAVRLGMLLGRVMSRKAGYRLGDKLARWIARHQNFSMVQAVKANQWVLRGENATAGDLEKFAQQVMQSAIRSLFDYFYFIRRPYELMKVISFGSGSNVLLERINQQQSCLLLGPHMSNFDLLAHGMALLGVKAQVLSFPNPNDAYKIQNKLREKAGLEVTPTSISAFRKARSRLREGGVVVTGVDRPLTGTALQKYRPRFCGREANLPVMHVRMAKEADVPIFVMCCVMLSDQTYQLQVSEPIWIKPIADPNMEIIINAEHILDVTEIMIKRDPGQWAMFYPIWPEVLNKLPGLSGKDNNGKES